MVKSENLSSVDLYTRLFKKAQGVWSLGAMFGNKRIKVDVQNQDVGNNPSFNVIIGDLSIDDLLLLTNFLSNNMSMDFSLSEDREPEERDPIADVVENKDEDLSTDIPADLVYSTDTSSADNVVVSKHDPIVEDEPDQDYDDLDAVFKDSAEHVTSDSEEISEDDPVESKEPVDEESSDEEDVSKDIVAARSISAVFEIFKRCGYSFEDEDEVVEALKEAQKELKPKALKNRRESGLRSEWGKFWRAKTKLKGG